MADINQSLTLVVYGPSKAGKSSLSVTTPAPRLMLDVEGGHRFLPIKAVMWDPAATAPPEASDAWDTCVVQCRDYETVLRVYQWLVSGQHPFRSVVVDSISELQVKIVEQLAGRGQIAMQAWGDILRTTTGLMRDLRDLTMHPTNPLQCVVLTAMERDGQDGKKQPFLSGQSAITLPYLFDITGYLRVEEFPNPDPTQPPYKVRRLYVTPTTFAVAGERVGGRLGDIIEQADLSVATMMEKIYGQPVSASVDSKSSKTSKATNTTREEVPQT